jgi:hypothetical protein
MEVSSRVFSSGIDRGLVGRWFHHYVNDSSNTYRQEHRRTNPQKPNVDDGK